jgi:uncharacterized DUF497 family protein
MLYIEDLIWDEHNLDHIARHNVTQYEVEEVCYSKTFVKRGRNGLLEVYGQTESGRYLVLFFARRGKGVYYPVTARDMVERERKTYLRARGH